MKPGGEGFDIVPVDGFDVRVWPPRGGQHVAQAWSDGRPAGVPAAHRERPVAVAMAVEDARDMERQLAERAARARRDPSHPR